MATIATALAEGPDALSAGPRSRVGTGPGGASCCLDLGAMRGTSILESCVFFDDASTTFREVSGGVFPLTPILA